MFNSKWAPHETLDLHELLSAKTLSISKASAYASFVSDPELKSMIETEAQMCSKHAQDIQTLLKS